MHVRHSLGVVSSIRPATGSPVESHEHHFISIVMHAVHCLHGTVPAYSAVALSHHIREINVIGKL